MNDHTRSERELETQLRTALRVDAARAEISDDAWTKVRDRTFERRGRTSRRPRLVLGAATAMAAAAATVAIMVVPGIVGPPNVAEPTPADTPTGRPSRVPVAKAPPVLAATEVGTDLRLRVQLVSGRGSADRATVRLSPYRWREGSWVPVGAESAAVGPVDGWAAGSRPAVCELRVSTKLPAKSSFVVVRLAARDARSDPKADPKAAAAACSRKYVFELTGDRLVAR